MKQSLHRVRNAVIATTLGLAAVASGLSAATPAVASPRVPSPYMCTAPFKVSYDFWVPGQVRVAFTNQCDYNVGRTVYVNCPFNVDGKNAPTLYLNGYQRLIYFQIPLTNYLRGCRGYSMGLQ